MWHCPNCEERHEDQFETCWKCGSDKTGGRDQDFRISESAAKQDQLPEGNDEVATPPKLKLPTITYFCIAAWPWVLLAISLINPSLLFETTFPEVMNLSASVLAPRIFISAIGCILIVLPIVWVMIQSVYLCIVRGYSLRKVRLLSMFLLPESIRRAYPWFVAVYYVSLGAWFVVPIVIGAMQLIRSGNLC